MFEFLMIAAQSPITPWIVLIGVGTVMIIESWKASHSALMGDMFAEGFDE